MAIANQHILVSRVDAIGDVVLTLPLCGYLKSIYPDVEITFLGRTYTGPIVKTCGAVDHFINYDNLIALSKEEQIAFLKSLNIDTFLHVYPQKRLSALAKKAGIKNRVGTINRIYHWFTCNKLVKLSRKKSPLHEAQLNIVLLQGLGIDKIPAINQLPDFYHFRSHIQLTGQFLNLLRGNKFNLILHPKSHGSGREWGLDKFKELIVILPSDRFNIFISGSDKEKVVLKDWLLTLPSHVIDITGQLSLPEFIKFIASADGLIASGTGPLHIAAAAGVHALGLFPGIRPINARRWGPIGKQAEYLESDGDNLFAITAWQVYDRIKMWEKELNN